MTDLYVFTLRNSVTLRKQSSLCLAFSSHLSRANRKHCMHTNTGTHSGLGELDSERNAGLALSAEFFALAHVVGYMQALQMGGIIHMTG